MEDEFYYVIRPNQEFCRIRAEYDLPPFLDEPALWIRPEIEDRFTTIDDRIFEFKLIFLADFWMRYWIKNTLYRNVVEILMGQPPLTVADFDKWWTVERLEIGNYFDAVLRRLSVESLEALSNTGDKRTEQWINHLIERRNKRQGEGD